MEIALCATVEERKGGFNRTIKIIVKNKIIKSSGSSKVMINFTYLMFFSNSNAVPMKSSGLA
jgi:hypothetical protein